MLCLRCSVLPSALRTLSSAPMASTLARNTLLKNTPTTPIRSLSTAVRPQLSQPTLSSIRAQLPSTTSAIAQQTRSFSASASLGGKRATYNPSRRVQKRRHGFLARIRTRGGRTVLQRRRTKGRRALSW